MEPKKHKILITPLNWGLGHASRCVPIIQLLQENNFEPIIASDGQALEFLRKEFPKLSTLELPSYAIKYAKKGVFLKWKLLASYFSIRRAVKEEHRIIDTFIKQNTIAGIISDNRFGAYNAEIPSVYITHQLTVLSGFTTFFTTRLHQKIISKFDVCWVPDSKLNLAGKLTFSNENKTKKVFIGNLSRLSLEPVKSKYDVLLLLSGPEPQRTLLEEKLIQEFKEFKGKVLLIRGLVKKDIDNPLEKLPHIEVIEYALTEDLQKIINESKLVVARSGYSTIMDLAKLQKKAFFIPTPGQSEQEYLAQNLKEKRIAPFCKQKEFTISMLDEVANYSGFQEDYQENLDKSLLEIFR